MNKIISKILRWGFKSWNIGIYRRLQNKEKETFNLQNKEKETFKWWGGGGGEHKENLTKLRNLCEAMCLHAEFFFSEMIWIFLNKQNE